MTLKLFFPTLLNQIFADIQVAALVLTIQHTKHTICGKSATKICQKWLKSSRTSIQILLNLNQLAAVLDFFCIEAKHQ